MDQTEIRGLVTAWPDAVGASLCLLVERVLLSGRAHSQQARISLSRISRPLERLNRSHAAAVASFPAAQTKPASSRATATIALGLATPRPSILLSLRLSRSSAFDAIR